MKLKVLFVSSEVDPFAKTGGLADVAGSLPIALKSIGAEVKVFLPYFRQAKAKDFGIKLLTDNLRAGFGNWDQSFSLYHCKKEKVDFYFINKDDYYNREFLYGSPTGDYPDNAQRFAFFANAVLASAEAIGFKPDVINCNDWQTALIPFYLKTKLANNPIFNGTKTLFTIHNLAYQGLFSRDTIYQIGVGPEYFTPDTLEFYDKVSFIKAGIIYSTGVSTVSKGYSCEILTNEFGCGLNGLLNTRKNDLFGILNGADYSVWNPESDVLIKSQYSGSSPEDKIICKKDLLQSMNLPPETASPLLGVISRLADQKGLDIIAAGVEEIVRLGCRLVILGSGDEKYHNEFMTLAARYPKNLSCKIAFDNTLAHKIEAGCDMFLMPSRYEPCGLNQMYSLKYGTIPIVRATGGLDDTITDYTLDKTNGNGFKFREANLNDFLDALKRALAVYKNKAEWETLTVKAMGLDFSWNQSAKEYLRIYSELMKKQ